MLLYYILYTTILYIPINLLKAILENDIESFVTLMLGVLLITYFAINIKYYLFEQCSLKCDECHGDLSANYSLDMTIRNKSFDPKKYVCNSVNELFSEKYDRTINLLTDITNRLVDNPLIKSIMLFVAPQFLKNIEDIGKKVTLKTKEIDDKYFKDEGEVHKISKGEIKCCNTNEYYSKISDGLITTGLLTRNSKTKDVDNYNLFVSKQKIAEISIKLNKLSKDSYDNDEIAVITDCCNQNIFFIRKTPDNVYNSIMNKELLTMLVKPKFRYRFAMYDIRTESKVIARAYRHYLSLIHI